MLHAATLELLSTTANQLTGSMQEDCVAFALQICNASSHTVAFTLSDEARNSLVATSSAVIAAGRMSHQSGSSAVAEVLERIHYLTIDGMSPGEDQLITRSALVALGSQKATCMFDACAPVSIAVPSFLNDGAPTDEEFGLSSESLAEITATTDCDAGGDLGFSIVQWAVSPFGTAVDINYDDMEVLSTVNSTVSSFSVTPCGREVKVSNLSTPVTITLVVVGKDEGASKANGADEECYLGVCESEAPIVVHCNSTDEDVNITCENKGSYNATCPRVSSFATCLFWNGEAWSDDGISTML